MKVLAHSKDPKSNELITYQGEIPTRLLPVLINENKSMEITWEDLPIRCIEGETPFDDYEEEPQSLITLTTSKPALGKFFDKYCPQYSLRGLINTFKSKKELTKNHDGYEELNEVEWAKSNQNKLTAREIQQIAEQMYDLYSESKAVELKEGEYHIPYIKDLSISILEQREIAAKFPNIKSLSELSRILRVSLISYPNETDYSKLIEIHDRLIKDKQLSTFVHCARVMSNEEYKNNMKGDISLGLDNYPSLLSWCDNYKGFISYKYIIENEKEQI